MGPSPTGRAPIVSHSSRTSRITGRGRRRMKARRTLVAFRKRRRRRGLSGRRGQRRNLRDSRGIFTANCTTVCLTRGAGRICRPSSEVSHAGHVESGSRGRY